jgi:hypothetical protein
MTRGSQLQVQLYVNRYEAELDAAVFAVFPELAAKRPGIGWTAPLKKDGYREPQGKAFLAAIERPDLWPLDHRLPGWDYGRSAC